MCKHLHLTQAEVVLVTAIVPDVHVAPLVSETIITGEQNAWILETTFEGCAGLIQRLALGQQLNDEYGEFLICIWKIQNNDLAVNERHFPSVQALFLTLVFPSYLFCRVQRDRPVPCKIWFGTPCWGFQIIKI